MIVGLGKKKFCLKFFLGSIGSELQDLEAFTWTDMGTEARVLFNKKGFDDTVLKTVGHGAVIPEEGVRPFGKISVEMALESDFEFEKTFPIQLDTMGRQYFPVIWCSVSRRNNRASDRKVEEWKLAFNDRVPSVPDGCWFSVSDWLKQIVPLNFSRLAFWGGSRGTFVLKPIVMDWEFAISVIIASIVEKKLLTFCGKWWPDSDASSFLDASWGTPLYPQWRR
mgnify:CR=1 FL=1